MYNVYSDVMIGHWASSVRELNSTHGNYKNDLTENSVSVNCTEMDPRYCYSYGKVPVSLKALDLSSQKYFVAPPLFISMSSCLVIPLHYLLIVGAYAGVEEVRKAVPYLVHSIKLLLPHTNALNLLCWPIVVGNPFHFVFNL